MSRCSINDTDISWLYVDTAYQDLKNRTHIVKTSEDTFICPYCPYRKQDNSYRELLQHAFMVDRTSSEKISARERANHLALLKYLEKDIVTMPGLLKPVEKDTQTSWLYIDRFYEELKKGSLKVRISDETFACPYCPKMKRPGYLYRELFEHASGVSQISSQKISVKKKATHMALMKYLKNDIILNVTAPSTSNRGETSTGHTSKEQDLMIMNVEHPTESANGGILVDSEKQFVWPWTGIVVNILTRMTEDGQCVGESGSKLRDEYRIRGFNPSRVRPLWNSSDHTRAAVVEFDKSWSGLYNALAFERAYELDHHGKKDWLSHTGQKSGLYARVARADDYQMNNAIGEQLQKMDVKTIPEIMEHDDRMFDTLVSSLNNTLQVKKNKIKEMEVECDQITLHMDVVTGEIDRLSQSHCEEMNKIQSSATQHFHSVLNGHELLKLQLESQKRELELRRIELEKREANNEIERKKLEEEINETSKKNGFLEMAAMEQQKASENVLKLAADQKRQKEQLHAKIIELEKQLNVKQKLELEIQQLKGKLNVMKHMKNDVDFDVPDKMYALHRDLREKELSLREMNTLNQTLVVKERKSNDELQEARKELITTIKEMPRRGNIGVKRMGELDSRPFLEAVKKKFNAKDAEDRASKLCSLWEEYLKDPDWHPFKIVIIQGKHQEVIDDEDEKLKELKNEMGEEVQGAVVAALKEINEYNPSGRYVTSELWNYAEGKEASLREGVKVLLKEWKLKRRKKGRR
ncbi:unnamed protein product [Lathyrus sativus]|nr:unnamed protein product [Lathyrus sativus]